MASNLHNETTTISLQVLNTIQSFLRSYIHVSSLAVTNDNAHVAPLITATKTFISERGSYKSFSRTTETFMERTRAKIALRTLPICTGRRRWDHAHLLHPRVFVFHNVRASYFCNELHLYEQNSEFYTFVERSNHLLAKKSSVSTDSMSYDTEGIEAVK
jgi:hypothetical protein